MTYPDTDDATSAQNDAPRPASARAWTPYTDTFRVVVRESDAPDAAAFSDALFADFGEIGGEVSLEEFVPQLQGWLAERGIENFNVEIRRSYVDAGAAGVGAELLITFFATTAGTVAGIAMRDLLAFVKTRLVHCASSRPSRDWLLGEDPADVADYFAWSVARALDRRRTDLSLVDLVRTEDEILAVFDAGDDRYEIKVDESAYRISRVE